jgi:hypothetical protein
VGEINILQIKSCDNLANLFTKSLPLATFDKYVKCNGMCMLKILQGSGWRFSLNRIPCFLISVEKTITCFYKNHKLYDQFNSRGVINSLKYKFELQVRVDS